MKQERGLFGYKSSIPNDLGDWLNNMAQISTMDNGGYLIECQLENEVIESCPWRSPDTCKSCDNVSCPRKITEENEG